MNHLDETNVMADYPTKALEKGGAVRQNRYRFILWIRDALLSVRLYRALRTILAVAFIGSGTVKLLDPSAFAAVIKAFGLIPESWVTLSAVGLPVLEVIAGVALLLDIRGGLTAVTIMITLFMVILIYGIRLGLDIDCGCFGPGDPEARAFHGLRSALYRDIVMVAGIIYLYFWRYCRSVKSLR
ncbi:MAG: MauE/DoxX family redox-associated membrane protein [Pseudomonadota bacterium]